MTIRLNTKHLEYRINPDGTNAAFIDRATGQDHLDHGTPQPCATIMRGDTVIAASAAAFEDGVLALRFGGAISTRVAVTAYEGYLALRVLDVTAPDETLAAIRAFTFLHARLTAESALGEPFAACVLALNLQTRVRELPQPTSYLQAECFPRFGFAGAEAALIACPAPALRAVMQAAVSAAPGVPHSPLGGPWAWDKPETRGSYMFNFGGMSEDTVDDWIRLAAKLGINQIDFHGGQSFRFGDCRPNPETYPNERASLKAVIDRLHSAGIKAGLHTYAFFIDKTCPWVTPVPDPRLAKDAYFTLAGALSAADTVVPVAEPTADMSTITGFFVRNSVTLQIDDELITYSGIDKQPPYAFTGCQRGAWGTRAASHAAGARIGHLKECFGLFVPDGDNGMLEEVAAASADMYNACGFDMMYLDALDGEDILGGAENAWHYGAKFAHALFNRVHKPPIMEMSTFHHHLWYIRSRIGAWDHPNRSHKRFIDLHCAENARSGRMFLPGHLGWWAVKTWTGPLNEPTFADDIEYLCGKALGNGVGFSVMGIEPGTIGAYPIYERLAGIMRQYEELRHADYFSDDIKARLREPGAEFTLRQDTQGRWRLLESHYERFKVEPVPGKVARAGVSNPYEVQACGLRIEALMGVADAEASPETPVLDLSAPDLGACQAAEGVEAHLDPVQMRLSAINHAADPNGAWAAVSRHLGDVDLSGREGLGVWVEGDGKGEVLNIQVRSPEHLTGGIADHYIPIDFIGWRYVTLVEPEGERYSQYRWPYGTAYTIYRENVDYRHIESVSLWLNGIPRGETVSCRVKPLAALPLREAALVNPAVSAGGRTVTFPVSIPSGCYLEYFGADDCKLYGQKGELLAEVAPQGSAPLLEPGANQVTLSAESAARARVTVITRGKLL